MRVRAQFRPPFLSVELSTFLNCDLTLIYLLLWATVESAERGRRAGDLRKTGINMNTAVVFKA